MKWYQFLPSTKKEKFNYHRWIKEKQNSCKNQVAETTETEPFLNHNHKARKRREWKKHKNRNWGLKSHKNHTMFVIKARNFQMESQLNKHPLFQRSHHSNNINFHQKVTVDGHVFLYISPKLTRNIYRVMFDQTF